MNEEEIRAKVAQMEKELATYMEEANLNIAYQRGRIAILKELLQPSPEPKQDVK